LTVDQHIQSAAGLDGFRAAATDASSVTSRTTSRAPNCPAARRPRSASGWSAAAAPATRPDPLTMATYEIGLEGLRR
jgi:hypothetical protein